MDDPTMADLLRSSNGLTLARSLLSMCRLALVVLLMCPMQGIALATNEASPAAETPQQSSQLDEALRRGSNPVWADALEEDVTFGRPLPKDTDVSDRHIDIQNENNSLYQWETSSGTVGTSGTNSDGEFLLFLFRLVLILLGLAFLGALIYMLLASPAAVRRRKRTVNEISENIVAQKAKLSDLPFELDQPLAGLKAQADYFRNNQDYRNAVIYLFSYLLVECDTAGCIRLARGKTNHRYVRELKSYPEVQQPFKRVVELFEEAFFGRKEISQGRFEAIWNELPSIERAISKSIQKSNGNTNGDSNNNANRNSNGTSNSASNPLSNRLGNIPGTKTGNKPNNSSKSDTGDDSSGSTANVSKPDSDESSEQRASARAGARAGANGAAMLVLGLASLLACSSAGCRQRVNAVYGESDSYVGECSPSGLTVFREMAEIKGHKTQILASISPSMNEAVQTIVWIPDKFPLHRPEVLAALQQWLDTGGKTLVYIGRDASPQSQYWSEVAKHPRLRVDDEQRIRAVRSAAEATLQLDQKRDEARDLLVTPWFYARKRIGPVKPITSFTGEWADVLVGQPTRIVARTELRPYRPQENQTVSNPTSGSPAFSSPPPDKPTSSNSTSVAPTSTNSTSSNPTSLEPSPNAPNTALRDNTAQQTNPPQQINSAQRENTSQQAIDSKNAIGESSDGRRPEEKNDDPEGSSQPNDRNESGRRLETIESSDTHEGKDTHDDNDAGKSGSTLKPLSGSQELVPEEQWEMEHWETEQWETKEAIRKELDWKSEGRSAKVIASWMKTGKTPPIGGVAGEEYAREFLPLDHEQLEIASAGQAGRGGRVSKLLMGSGAEALVVQIDQEHTTSKVLIVSNASIVSNVGMLGVGQRRIAERMIERFSPGGVGFISGSGDPLLRASGSEIEEQRGFEMLTVWPLNVLTIHGAVAAMVAILAFSPIFGRPKRLRGASTADFGEHVQAVGELIRGTGDVQYAKRTISKYFRVVRGDSVSAWSTLDDPPPPPPNP